MIRQQVGVMVPTFNRPDLLRACVLQLAAQSRPPDLVCVHQNGHAESYEWAVADLRLPMRLAWLHTPDRLRQQDWYAVPLRHLLAAGCTHFFWADHDDLYLRDHVAVGLAELADWDFSVSRRAGLLYTQAGDWRYQPEVAFTAHAPGGMSSTMCFTRPFAEQLLQDLQAGTGIFYADNVLAQVTMPKFRCFLSSRRTCIYHAHEGSVTSSGWVKEAFR
jgi:hypothetical protein